jgi:hypothetical protein
MKKLLTILFAVALGLNLSAQEECMNPDVNCDGYVNVNDLLGLLGYFGSEDLDGDGIWDSQDDCVEDECGICDGSGPQFLVVDTITFVTDSTFIEAINEWYVFDIPDTTFTFVCANYGCMNPEALNYEPEAVIDDGNCVMDWMQLGQDIDGAAYARVSLSSDGTVMAIGGTRVYSWNGSSWSQLGEDIDGPFGHSASLSSDGTVVAIGTPFSNANGINSGHVRIYAWDGSSWSQLGEDIDGEAEYDASGYSVSLSSDGTVVAIGAPFNNGNGSISGHTRIYSWSGSSWSQIGEDIDAEALNDVSGWSVSLSSDGTVVAIAGASLNENNGDHTRIYTWDGSSWSKRGEDIDGEAMGDQSEVSVSISSDGTVVAIGAATENGYGQTRIYAWDGCSWSQLGGDIDGEATGDNSGWSVSLSSGGTVVAIGAPYNGCFPCSSPGHTRIYSWDGSSWSQLGGDIEGEDVNAQSGHSVSLSSDGTVVAIGAFSSDSFRVYSIN